MRSIYTISLLMFLSQAIAQPPGVFYVKCGGSGQDIGYGVVEIPYRRYVAIGLTTSFGKGMSDVFVTCIDSMGQVIWKNTYGESGVDIGTSIAYLTADSSLICAGYSNANNVGYDILLFKLNNRGDVIWRKYYGGTDWDFAYDVKPANDGNIVLCGKSYNGSYGDADGLVMKVDAGNGQLLWQKYFGGTEYDELNRVQVLTNDTVILGGNTCSYSDLKGDIWLLKLAANGDSVTSAAAGKKNRSERFYDFMLNSQNNYMIAGSVDTSLNQEGKRAAYVYKTKRDFSFVDDFIFSAGLKSERLTTIVDTKTGGSFFGTRSSNNLGNQLDVEPVLYMNNYSYLNSKTHGDLLDDDAHRSIISTDGGYVVVGYRTNESTGDPDLYLLKLDAGFSYAPQVVSLLEGDATVKRRHYVSGTRLYLSRRADWIEIYASSGALVYSEVISSGEVDLSRLSPGIYFLLVKGDDIETLKVIVENR